MSALHDGQRDPRGAVTLRLDYLPPTNAADNEHWRAKHRRHHNEWNLIYWTNCKNQKPRRPYQFALVTMTRHSSTEPDSDNLAASFKHLRDCLQVERAKDKSGLGYIVSDGPKHATFLYRWEPAPKGHGYVTIDIWPAPPHSLGEPADAW